MSSSKMITYFALFLDFVVIGTLAYLIYKQIFTHKDSRDNRPNYHVILQTEEALHAGDTLQVLDVTKSQYVDTIFIGYLN